LGSLERLWFEETNTNIETGKVHGLKKKKVSSNIEKQNRDRDELGKRRSSFLTQRPVTAPPPRGQKPT